MEVVNEYFDDGPEGVRTFVVFVDDEEDAEKTFLKRRRRMSIVGSGGAVPVPDVPVLWRV